MWQSFVMIIKSLIAAKKKVRSIFIDSRAYGWELDVVCKKGFFSELFFFLFVLLRLTLQLLLFVYWTLGVRLLVP